MIICLHFISSGHFDSPFSLSFCYSLHYFCHEFVFLLLGTGYVFLNIDYSVNVWVKGLQLFTVQVFRPWRKSEGRYLHFLLIVYSKPNLG